MPFPTLPTTYQPFKALYLLTAVSLYLAKLPFWLAKYTFTRPHPTWSFRQALVLRITRAFLRTVSAVQMRTPLPLTPGKEGERFVVIRRREEDGGKFVGPMLANEETVVPGDVGGTWYPSPLGASSVAGEEDEDVLVVLHIHGGAYVIGDGRTEASGYTASSLLAHTPATHVLCPQYRLSSLPPSRTSNPFPAALQDTLTAYLHLLHDLRIPASRIVLSGDSAGGNCTIALLRYIAEHGADLGIPSPKAALLWSPWIDPTDISPAFVHANPNFSSDYIHPYFVTWGALAFAGEPASASSSSLVTRYSTNPYVNAKVSSFRTRVPVWVSMGGAEVLCFDGKEWVEMMRGEEGNEVVFDVEEGVCHDVFLVATGMGLEREAAAMARRCGEWLEKL